MGEKKRTIAREIALKHLKSGDPLGWFESLYLRAHGNSSMIPWADLEPNPNLVEWLQINRSTISGEALIVGCGLGDDAEAVARTDLETTAFDISEAAISWSKRRFPDSHVTYCAVDLFRAPQSWHSRFRFVLESYTLQVLPPDLRETAIQDISAFVAPGGTLLVLARGREEDSSEGTMPWPLTVRELCLFEAGELQKESFEDYMDNEDPPVRRFRARYIRKC